MKGKGFKGIEPSTKNERGEKKTCQNYLNGSSVGGVRGKGNPALRKMQGEQRDHRRVEWGCAGRTRRELRMTPVNEKNRAQKGKMRAETGTLHKMEKRWGDPWSLEDTKKRPPQKDYAIEGALSNCETAIKPYTRIAAKIARPLRTTGRWRPIPIKVTKIHKNAACRKNSIGTPVN